MGIIQTLKCEKCNDSFPIRIGVEGFKDGKSTFEDTFLCKDCGNIQISSSAEDDKICKKCGSKNLTKDWEYSDLKCPKCKSKLVIVTDVES